MPSLFYTLPFAGLFWSTYKRFVNLINLSTVQPEFSRIFFNLTRSLNAKHKNLKTFAVLVYGHVYIMWSYQEAKMKSPIF